MRGIYKTDIESLMYKALKKENISFTFQYPIRCRWGYSADFFINPNIIIETDGEHWHKKGNSHDRKKDWALRKLGFVIIRFRGNQIKNNIQECISIVKQTIEET